MDFLLFALLAGIGVAIVAAPLGSLVVWQRLAYFGDTLAHSALVGIAFGLLLSISLQASIIASCLAVALILTLWQNQRQLPTDTLLGIISHSSLAFGLILVSVFDSGRVDLSSYLLGDILSSNAVDVGIIVGVGTVVILLVWRFWSQLLAVTVNEAMAQAEGVAVKRVRLLFLALLAITIAIAVKVVGVLLMTALLIIPAASACYLSRSPEQMVFFAALLGCLAVVGGLASSFLWNTPAGPSIVASSTILLLIILVYRRTKLIQ